MDQKHSTSFSEVLRSSLGRDMRGDGPPHWRESRNNNPPMSAAEARRLRRLLVKTLDAHSGDHPNASELAHRLNACRLISPCLSGACPVCYRALRRVIVHASRHLFREVDQYQFVTCICAPEKAAQGRLHTADPFMAVERRLMTIAIRHRVRILGGLDISANEHRQHLYQPHFMPQAHLLIATADLERIEKDFWKQHFPRGPLVNVPVQAKRHDGRRRAVAYSLHPITERRDSIMRHVASNGTQERANTRDKPLRRQQRFELALMLDRAGIDARIITHGYELRGDGHDVLMAPVNLQRASELLAERQRRLVEHREEHFRRERESIRLIRSARFRL